MPRTISFSEEIDKINDAFPVVLYCAKCDRLRLMKLERSSDPATFNAESNQVTEDQIGLDKGQRRDVQRRLNGLGFDTKVTGKFDESTRAVITRWQAARGYTKSGYLNQLQHKALLTEIVSAQASSSDEDSDDHPSRRHHGGGGGGSRHYRGGGGPGGFIGGVVGGLFR